MVKCAVEMVNDDDHEDQLPPDGHNRCSRLCVHVTDNETRYRALPLRGQNSLPPLENYGAMSGVLESARITWTTRATFQGASQVPSGTHRK